jgi:hypothetical protein
VNADEKRTLIQATFIAALAEILLGYYVSVCANVHLCDFLSIPAVLLLWPVVKLGGGGLEHGLKFWTLFALTTIVWVWPLTFFVLRWALQRRSDA